MDKLAKRYCTPLPKKENNIWAFLLILSIFILDWFIVNALVDDVNKTEAFNKEYDYNQFP